MLHLSSTPEGLDNTRALGRLIYTDYIFLFQAAALVLMVAMIGAIVLTHRARHTTRRQSIAVQNARTNTLTMVDAGRGAGVDMAAILRPLPESAEPALMAANESHEHGVGLPGPGEHG